MNAELRRAYTLSMAPDLLSLVHRAMAEQNTLRETLARLFEALEDLQQRTGGESDQAAELPEGGTHLVPSFPADRSSPPPPAPDLPRVQVHCLGSFELLIDGVRAENWRAGKACALFKYLVNHRQHPVSRDALIEALWPDPEAANPATSLKVAVHGLRQILGQVGGDALATAVQAHESGYLLQGGELWLDVEEFERCFALGRSLEAKGREAESLSLYSRAADLYRGDFLADSWDDWVIFRRENLKDQYLFILARLGDAALAARDYRACILRCQQLLEKDRCREDTYRTLLLCHARLGQRGRVRRWYELCVRTLRADLDVAPDSETESVYRRALSGRL